VSEHAVDLTAVTLAVREAAGGDWVMMLVLPAEEPRPAMYVYGEPGILWAEIVPSQAQARAGWSTQEAAQLAALGWRPPARLHGSEHQYFHPTRKRHHGEIAEHLARTFRDALGAPGELLVRRVDPDAKRPDLPTFQTGAKALCKIDTKLLELARRALQEFEPDTFDTHLELTIRRGYHRVRIGVFAHDGTLTCRALHLPNAPAPIIAAALAANDRLDRVAYSYAVRRVRGHGRSLVLQSKVSLLPYQRIPPVVGMLLHTTIEPLVDAHRALHR
jgi:hypothetical protein